MTDPLPINAVEHCARWSEEFISIADPIRKVLAPLALRVDHIGSTSVPGLAAKDIIDVQVTVRDLSPDVEGLFRWAGYSRLEYNQDHRPPTATGPDRDWEKQFNRPLSGARPANVHVRRAMSANGRYALLFRDYLRTHPLAAAAYAQVKTALAQHTPSDWDLYYEIKDPVCDIIMARAEDWPIATGWHIEHYA